MPVITVTLIEGYSDETLREIEERLTDGIRTVIDAPIEGTTVIVNQVSAAGYMRGGVAKTPGEHKPRPKDIVRRFLGAMEARDLEQARAFLATGFTMTFPGGVTFSRLEELIEWARPRYKTISKTYEGFEDVPGPEGTVVYCRGTLSGIWPDGAGFEKIRFIDRFTVKDSKLVDQMVWNDLTEIKHH